MKNILLVIDDIYFEFSFQYTREEINIIQIHANDIKHSNAKKINNCDGCVIFMSSRNKSLEIISIIRNVIPNTYIVNIENILEIYTGIDKSLTYKRNCIYGSNLFKNINYAILSKIDTQNLCKKLITYNIYAPTKINKTYIIDYSILNDISVIIIIDECKCIINQCRQIFNSHIIIEYKSIDYIVFETINVLNTNKTHKMGNEIIKCLC